MATAAMASDVSARGKAPVYAAEDVEFVRNAAKTMNDTTIAARLNWQPLRVRNLRRKHGIPPVPGFWTDERSNLLERLYVIEGRTMYETAAALGISPEQVRQRSRTMKLKRPREFRDQNLIVSNGRGDKRLVFKGERPRAARKPRQLHNAPVRFAQQTEPKVWEPLIDRIERELARKPASAPTLAILLDEKELYVSRQLAAMQHAGKATPISGEGRYRTWGIAA